MNNVVYNIWNVYSGTLAAESTILFILIVPGDTCLKSGLECNQIEN